MCCSGLRSNGEEFPIEASISQIRDGEARLYTVMLRDITERVKAESAQRQAREELRELSANLQKVREEEKTRIARELHDDLGQQLTALKMDISSVEQALETHRRTAPVREQLQGMRRLIDATVASVRRIAADLRPVMLDDLGLIPAIEWLANDFTNRYGIDVERRIEVGDARLRPAGAHRAVPDRAGSADECRPPCRCDAGHTEPCACEGAAFVLQHRRQWPGRAPRGRAGGQVVRLARRSRTCTHARRHGRDPYFARQGLRVDRYLSGLGGATAGDANMTRVLIADDHALVRDGLRHILQGASGFEVVGEANDGVQHHRADPRDAPPTCSCSICRCPDATASS